MAACFFGSNKAPKGKLLKMFGMMVLMMVIHQLDHEDDHRSPPT